VSLWPSLIAIGVFGLFVVALLLRRRMDLIWLFAAGCCVMVLTYYGSLGSLVDMISVNEGARYYYVPQAVFALVVLGLAATGHDIVAKLSWIVVVWLVVVGMARYFRTLDYVAHDCSWPRLAQRSEGVAQRSKPRSEYMAKGVGDAADSPRQGPNPVRVGRAAGSAPLTGIRPKGARRATSPRSRRSPHPSPASSRCRRAPPSGSACGRDRCRNG
jgi:hypothetical protein